MFSKFNKYILAEEFNINPLMPFILNKNSCKCKMEIMRLKADEVILRRERNQEELILVTAGFGGVVIDGESKRVKTGDLIYIPKNTLRSVANINKDELLQIVWITIE